MLTVKESYYWQVDPSKMNDVSESDHIVRTAVWPDPARMYHELKKYVYRILGKREPLKESTHSYPESFYNSHEGQFARIRRVLRSLLFVLPEGGLGWVIPAFMTARKMIVRFQIDSIYSSGPPHAAHVIGVLLKKVYGLKWVADFRDPWRIMGGKGEHRRSRVSKKSRVLVRTIGGQSC